MWSKLRKPNPSEFGPFFELVLQVWQICGAKLNSSENVHLLAKIGPMWSGDDEPEINIEEYREKDYFRKKNSKKQQTIITTFFS